MIALLEQNRQKIQQLCEKHHVRKLSVFGSAAREHDFHESSDIDFLLEFPKDFLAGRSQAYFELCWALEALLGRKVDVGEAEALKNPYVKRSIERDLCPLYIYDETTLQDTLLQDNHEKTVV